MTGEVYQHCSLKRCNFVLTRLLMEAADTLLLFLDTSVKIAQSDLVTFTMDHLLSIVVPEIGQLYFCRKYHKV